MSAQPTILTRAFWRSRRSAAVAGILFAVLLLVAMTLLRLALADDGLAALRTDPQRRNLVRWSLNIIPFAGIAFLWFIGVIRDQLGAVEDRLFSTVFLGSGLLFLAMLFTGAATTTSLIRISAGPEFDPALWDFGAGNAQALFSVFAMRMAAVFTLAVSTVGLRTSSLPRWVSFLGYATGLVLLVAADAQKWTQLLFPTWVFLVSVTILVSRPPVSSGESGRG